MLTLKAGEICTIVQGAFVRGGDGDVRGVELHDFREGKWEGYILPLMYFCVYKYRR